MKIDVSQSVYHEDERTVGDYTKVEVRRLRFLLRRLRFLETQVRENGGLQNGGDSGGSAFAEWEMEALEWLLDDIGFLKPRDDRTGLE